MLVIILSLSACSTLETSYPTFGSDWSQQPIPPVGLSKWKIEGRIGVRTSDDSWHANLTWEHDRDVDRLQIYGPLGRGAVNIWLDGDESRMELSDGMVYRSTAPDQLFRSRTGIVAPVRALSYWVQGLPFPKGEYQLGHAPSGRLEFLDQGGWSVQYHGYASNLPWHLPRKLSVFTNDTRLKLVIDSWDFPQGEK
jgi:outer membrane lipoprotein LolB